MGPQPMFWPPVLPQRCRSADRAREGELMGKVIAAITTSLDGRYTGPDDGPGRGLGIGGERLHYWVFGGPWTYAAEPEGSATGADTDMLEAWMSEPGSGHRRQGDLRGRRPMGRHQPLGCALPHPHAPARRQPPRRNGLSFVGGLDEALEARGRPRGRGTFRSWAAATSSARPSRRARSTSYVTVAPVVLGGGKRLFDGFDQTVGLEQVRAVQSDFATHLHYRVVSG